MKELGYFEGVIFPQSEYKARYERLIKLMKRDNIGCAILTDDRHTWYYTGFGGSSPMGSRARPRILIVPQAGEPTFIVHRSTEFCVREMTWVNNIKTYKDLMKSPTDIITKTILEYDLENKVIGVELGQEQRMEVPYKDFIEIKDSLKNYNFKDISALMLEVKSIKSDLELERIAKACEITSSAYVEGFKKLKPGMTEIQVGGLLEDLMKEQGASSTWSWVIASDYHRIDGLTRNKPIEEGQLIFVDMGANVGGYWSDFSRSAVIGKTKKDFMAMQSLINEVCILGIEAMKPGIKTSQVAKIVEKEMAQRNLVFNSNADRYGHGMGLFVTEPPHISAFDDTIIQEGMVLTLEPGMFTEDGMFHLEENVYITKDGPVFLSKAPREITVV